jgi:hypothetical protein
MFFKCLCHESRKPTSNCSKTTQQATGPDALEVHDDDDDDDDDDTVPSLCTYLYMV